MSLTSLPLGNMIMESAYLTTSRYIGDQHTSVVRKRRQQRKEMGTPQISTLSLIKENSSLVVSLHVQLDGIWKHLVNTPKTICEGAHREI